MANVDNPSDTSGSLIAASKVNGTSVYNSSGEKLGSIYDVMIDKISGKTEYAVLELRRLPGHRRQLLSTALA